MWIIKKTNVKKNRHSKPTKIEGTPFPIPGPIQKANGYMVSPDLSQQLLMENESPGNWVDPLVLLAMRTPVHRWDGGWIGTGSFYWFVSLVNGRIDRYGAPLGEVLSTVSDESRRFVGCRDSVLLSSLSSKGLGVEVGLLNATLKKKKGGGDLVRNFWVLILWWGWKRGTAGCG